MALPFKNFKGAQENDMLLFWVKYFAVVSNINIYFCYTVKAGSVYIIFFVFVTVNKLESSIIYLIIPNLNSKCIVCTQF